MRLLKFLLAIGTIFPTSILASPGMVPTTAASTLSPTSASSASIPTSPTTLISSTRNLIALTETPTLTILGGEEPQITEKPEVLNGDVDMQLQEKYHMTTYWSCVTIATQVHCGWHEPVLPGGDEIAGALGRGPGNGLGTVVGLVAGVVAVLMR